MARSRRPGGFNEAAAVRLRKDIKNYPYLLINLMLQRGRSREAAEGDAAWQKVLDKV